MTYRVRITAAAEASILGQARYIAVDQHAPLEAARWLERVYRTADTLDTWPRRCAKAPEDAFRDFDIHKLVIDGFTLLFTIDEATQTVWVIGTRGRGQMPKPAELPSIPPAKGAGPGG